MSLDRCVPPFPISSDRVLSRKPIYAQNDLLRLSTFFDFVYLVSLRPTDHIRTIPTSIPRIPYAGTPYHKSPNASRPHRCAFQDHYRLPRAGRSSSTSTLIYRRDSVLDISVSPARTSSYGRILLHPGRAGPGGTSNNTQHPPLNADAKPPTARFRSVLFGLNPRRRFPTLPTAITLSYHAERPDG